MIKKLLIILIPIILFPIVAAQDNDEHDELHEHTNEVGFAFGLATTIGEANTAPGLHLHYTRSLGEQQKFGIGVGLEAIIDIHQHYAVMITGSYRPVHRLFINIGPALLYEEEFKEYGYAGHFEMGYEFELRSLHLGPLVEAAIGPSDAHVMFGMHLGYAF